MNNDSQLAGGVNVQPTFGNEEPSNESQKLQDDLRNFIEANLPTSKEEVASINKELSTMNNLTDFVNTFGGDMPASLDAKRLQAELHGRFAYMNYLITRKNAIISALQTVNYDIPNVLPDQPAPTHVPTYEQLFRNKKETRMYKAVETLKAIINPLRWRM